MCLSSLISLSVRLASILLSKALAIFLIATSSCVSLSTAELRRNARDEDGGRERQNIKSNGNMEARQTDLAGFAV